MLNSSPARQFGRRAVEAPATKVRRSVSVQQQPQRAARATNPAPALPAETIVAAATPSVAVAWSWRSKFWSYFKGVMAAMVALAVMTAILDGREPSSTTALRINTYFPMMYMCFIMSPILVPVILGLAKCADYLELPRGVSDVAVGATLMALMAIPMGNSVKGGVLLVIGKALAMLLAGAIGGFTFWRADGYPRRTAVAKAPV